MATTAEFGPLFQPVTFLRGVPVLLPPPAGFIDDGGPLKTFVGPIYQPVFFLNVFRNPGPVQAPPPGMGGSSTPGIIN